MNNVSVLFFPYRKEVLQIKELETANVSSTISRNRDNGNTEQPTAGSSTDGNGPPINRAGVDELDNDSMSDDDVRLTMAERIEKKKKKAKKQKKQKSRRELRKENEQFQNKLLRYYIEKKIKKSEHQDSETESSSESSTSTSEEKY